MIALGVKMTGERKILGFAVGPCESEPFWREFLKRLAARGLCEVKLVISDAHEGLKKAIREVALEAQRRRLGAAHVAPRRGRPPIELRL